MRRQTMTVLENFIFLIATVSLSGGYSPDVVEILNTENTKWGGWIKNTEKYDGWRSQNIPPNGQLVYGLCFTSNENRGSWLRSPFIRKEEAFRINIEITFTMRSCKTRPEHKINCEDSFHLMVYEADGPSDLPSSWNDRIYTRVAIVSPDIKWSDTRQENIMNIKTYSIQPGRAGFFIALRDIGACVMVKLVRVYYVACAAITRLFADYSRVVVSQEYELKNVKGTCVPGAELIDSQKAAYMLCGSSGQWHFLETMFCHCKAGYTPSDNNMICLKCQHNTYKPYSGSEKCEFCSKHSYSEQGSANCTCNQGLIAVMSYENKVICVEPLKNPSNLRTNTTVKGQILLEWDKYPNPDNFRNPRESIFYQYKIDCVSCKEYEKLNYSPRSVVTGTFILIDALESGTVYNFSVRATSFLGSEMTIPIQNSSASFISVTTKISDDSYSIRDLIINKMESNHSILISWVPITGIKLVNYQIVICSLTTNPGSSKLIILDPVLKNIKVTQYEFSYYKKPVFAYRIKVRARHASSWGPFTTEKQINLNDDLNSFPNQEEIEESKGESWSPKKLIVISLFGCGLVIMIVSIPLCFFCRYITSRSIKTVKKKRSKKPLSEPQEMANYSQIYTGSSTTRVYIDPSNYEDPSTMVQEFALEIDPDKVKIECVIGEGEFGEVCKGRLLKLESRRRILVAVKTLKSNFSEKEKMNFLTEAAIMGQFDHPNIIRLEGVVTKTQPVMILTQFMENGSLDIFLKKNKSKFSNLQLMGMLRGIASGMRYLSDMHYVHRDLAARNILIDRNLCCKVSDFGLSREIEADSTEGAYTTKGGLIPIRWTAPEAINYRRFTSSSDVWSFGIVMWEVMSYGERPYWDWANKDVLQSIEAGYRLPAPKNCPQSVHLLMLECWIYERAERPKFLQILHSIEALMRCPESLTFLPVSISTCRLSSSNSYNSNHPLIPIKHQNHRSISLLTQEPVFSPESSISQWLNCLELQCYKEWFTNQNLVYLFQISKFNRNDLLSLGIRDAQHLQKLMCNIEAMQNYFDTTQTTSFSLL